MSTDEMLMLADVMEKTAFISVGRGFRMMGRTARRSVDAARRAAEQGGTFMDQARAARGVLSKRLDTTSARDAMNIASALGTAGLAGYGAKRLLVDDAPEVPPEMGVLRRY